MKGLIYKDNAIFFKSIDRKTILVIGGTLILLLFSAGAYSGLITSVMLAMFIGMQNVMSFASDEKAKWEKYQLAMPVSTVSAIVSKYTSVLCTLLAGLAGSTMLNLITSIVYHQFDLTVWGISAVIIIIVPLVWTGIGLPLSYWFGSRSAQVIGLVSVFPIFYFVKYFDDGPGFSAMADFIQSHALLAGSLALLLFILSMLVSMLGYNRKKYG